MSARFLLSSRVGFTLLIAAAISGKLFSVVTGYGQESAGSVSLLFSPSRLFATGSELEKSVIHKSGKSVDHVLR